MPDATYQPKVYKKNGGDAIVVADGGSLQRELTSLTAATATVTADAHAGRTLVLNRAGGVTVTLPAASGSGALFKFSIGTALSSASHVIQVANANDYLRGAILAVTDSAAGSAPDAWPTSNSGTVATESDTITLDGSTKGGNIGDVIELEDIAANVWRVSGLVKASGTEATPFSAAV